jgi:16S rRNA C967 or C1407 C5-methylase (RsmB/RsmF family)
MARSKQQGRKGKQNKKTNEKAQNEKETELDKNQLEEAEKAKNKTQLYESIVKTNERFEQYYKQLNLIEESEWSSFINVLKEPLPVTFRITSYKSHAKQVLNILKAKHFKYLDDIVREDGGKKVAEASANRGASLIAPKLNSSEQEKGPVIEQEIYKCLDWYPNELVNFEILII